MMMKKMVSETVFVFLIIVVMVLAVSCKEEKEQSQLTVNIVNIDEVREKYIGLNGVIFIDNRPKSKHENEGHIEGSINLPYFDKGDATNVMTKELLEKHAKKTDTIVFYCSGAMRAHNAALAAIEWGYDPQKIFWYKGGWREWKNQGK